MESESQHKLYSLRQAAKEMHIGKGTLSRLISQGKLGTIQIGKRKKIPYSEIEKFQQENTVRQAKEAENTNTPVTPKGSSQSKNIFKALREEILNGERI